MDLLIIIPATAAKRLTGSLKGMLVLAVGIAVCVTVLGCYGGVFFIARSGR